MSRKGIFLLCWFVAGFVFAEPLKVTIAIHEPPFVFQTGKNQFSGFDIAMMNYICSKIDRPCQYSPIPLKQMINSVSTGRFDVGVSAITITPERLKQVRFSDPYLPSYCQFMVKKAFNKPYSLPAIQQSSIGYVNGTLFAKVLNTLGADTNLIRGYDDEFRLIEALNNNNIDIAIVDAPSTAYWINYGNGKFKAFGDPFKYGIGIAIAIRPDQPELVDQINRALADYQKTKAYQQHIQFFINADFSTNE